MKKDFGPQTYLFPLPVLIIGTYDKEGKADAMNAAWGGINDTNQIHLCLSTDHKTTQNIILNKEFTIAYADKAHVVESDYFGIATGNKVEDKIKKAGMTASKAPHINAPLIEEYPVSVECKVKTLVSDDQGTTFIVADIINVLADEKCLGKDGKIDTQSIGFISYEPVHHKYLVLGEEVGSAFKDGLKLK